MEIEQNAGHSALDYQFICQTVGSLYLDWLNVRRQSTSLDEGLEASYAERVSTLQNQVQELIVENENLKTALTEGPDSEEPGEEED